MISPIAFMTDIQIVPSLPYYIMLNRISLRLFLAQVPFKHFWYENQYINSSNFMKNKLITELMNMVW